jgi:hypothetical protein
MKRFRIFVTVLALLPVPVAPGTYEQSQGNKTVMKHRQNDNDRTSKPAPLAPIDKITEVKRQR